MCAASRTTPSVNYSVFRPLKPLYDVDDINRKSPIAYEAFYLGTAKITRPGEVARVEVTESKQEIGVGDRLLPVEPQPLISYVPKAPASPIEARIIAIYGDGVRFAGGTQIITLNRGSNEGLTIGDTVQLWRAGETIADRTLPGKQYVKLPDEQIGLAFVFRVFPTISYALIQRGTRAGGSRRPRLQPDRRSRPAATAGDRVRSGPRATAAAATAQRAVSPAATRAAGRARCMAATDGHARTRAAHGAALARILRPA